MIETYDFHVDMSGRIYKREIIGIALVGANTKINYGCALKRNFLEFIKKNLFLGNIHEDSARLYAICIYLLIKNVEKNIRTLIICNDENFNVVKKVLNYLLGGFNFEIINITEFRRRLGRKVGSLADNYAKIYRKRALKANRQIKGKKINVVKVTYKLIKKYWEEINKKV
jgi:hypothetical protein